MLPISSNFSYRTTSASFLGSEKISSKEDMSLEEYKQYIQDKIAKIPKHPSHSNVNVTISISEEGFLAMKNDPEYEAWVLDYLKEDFSVDMSLITSHKDWKHYSVYSFGSSKADFKGYGWSDAPLEENEKKGKQYKFKIDFQLFFPFLYEDDANKLWEESKERREEFADLRKKAYFQHQERLKNFQKKFISDKYEQNFIFHEKC